MKRLLCLLPVVSLLLAGCQLASKHDPANPLTREPLLPPMPPGFIMPQQENYFKAAGSPRAPMAAMSEVIRADGYGTIVASTNGFIVEFTGWNGPYELQVSPNLTNWVTLGTATNDTGIPIRVMDVRKEGDRTMFYRLKGL
jgi:hypothetical protein